MNTATAGSSSVASTITFRYIVLTIIGLAIGTVIGWFARGTVDADQIRALKSEIAIEKFEAENQRKMNEMSEMLDQQLDDSELDFSSNPMKISVPYLYGQAVGGAITFQLLTETDDEEMCAFITAHLESSGAKKIADLPVGRDIKHEVVGMVRGTLIAIDVDCEGYIEDW